jgi:FkbM family methyltransferase
MSKKELLNFDLVEYFNILDQFNKNLEYYIINMSKKFDIPVKSITILVIAINKNFSILIGLIVIYYGLVRSLNEHKNIKEIKLSKEYFKYENIIRNYVKFIKLFNNLQDNQSKKLLISFIKVKLSNDYANIKNYNFKDQYYLKKNGKKFNNIIDVGGYDGDTLKFFLKKKLKFKKYFIFEPDFKNYLKLKKNVKNINNSNIFIYNYAAGNQNGEIFFQSLGNSKSRIKLNKNLKTKKIKIVKLDKIIKESSATINIKNTKGLNGRMTQIMPFVFLGIFFILAIFRTYYRNQLLKNSK